MAQANRKMDMNPELLGAIVKRMSIEIETKDRKSLTKTLMRSFSGKDAEKWLCKKGLARDSVDAILVCNTLMRLGYFSVADPAEDAAAPFRGSETMFYRFAVHETGEALSKSKTIWARAAISAVKGMAGTSKGSLKEDVASPEEIAKEGEKRRIDTNKEIPPPPPGHPDDPPPPEPRPQLTKKEEYIQGLVTGAVHAATKATMMMGWPDAVHYVAVVVLSILFARTMLTFLIVVPLAVLYLWSLDTKHVNHVKDTLRSEMWRAAVTATMGKDDAEVARWWNRIISAMWVGWIEPWLNRLLRNIIENALNNAPKPPVLESLKLTSFRMGTVAPHFKTCRVYTGGPDNETKLEMETDLRTTDLDISVEAHIGKGKISIPLAVYASDLYLGGLLRLGFQWMPHAPYVKSLRVGFVKVPKWHLSVKPLASSGTDVTSLPIIENFLKTLVDNLLDKFIVEPNPFLWKIEQWWWNMHKCTHLCVHREPFGLPKGATVKPAKDSRPRDLPLAWVELVILEGKKLETPFKIRNHTYVRASQPQSKHPAKLRTGFGSNSGNVTSWNEHLTIPVTNWMFDSEIYIDIKEREAGGLTSSESHKLGFCTLDARDYLDGQIHDLNITLGGVTTGQLRVRVCVISPGWDTLDSSPGVIGAEVVPHDKLPKGMIQPTPPGEERTRQYDHNGEELIDQSSKTGSGHSKSREQSSVSGAGDGAASGEAVWSNALKAGWMSKLGRGLKSTSPVHWTRRFFTLSRINETTLQLSYFTTKDCNLMKGSLTIDEKACVRHLKDPREMKVLGIAPKDQSKQLLAICPKGFAEAEAGASILSPASYEGSLIVEADHTEDLQQWHKCMHDSLARIRRHIKDAQAGGAGGEALVRNRSGGTVDSESIGRQRSTETPKLDLASAAMLLTTNIHEQHKAANNHTDGNSSDKGQNEVEMTADEKLDAVLASNSGAPAGAPAANSASPSTSGPRYRNSDPHWLDEKTTPTLIEKMKKKGLTHQPSNGASSNGSNGASSESPSASKGTESPGPAPEAADEAPQQLWSSKPAQSLTKSAKHMSCADQQAMLEEGESPQASTRQTVPDVASPASPATTSTPAGPPATASPQPTSSERKERRGMFTACFGHEA